MGPVPMYIFWSFDIYITVVVVIECHLGKKVLPEIGVANDPSRTPDSAVPTVIIHVCRYSI